MTGLRVLITNNTLAVRAGTELYVRDLALGLLERGHTPIAYSTHLGDVAEELRTATVPVVEDLQVLASPPDIIHGHHHLDTMTALLHFPSVPAIYVCHGWLPWEEAPPKFPRILRYLAVSETCKDFLVWEHGIAPDRVRVLFNFADLRRFRPRPPLPREPRQALVFANTFATAGPELQAIRDACEQMGIALDAVGAGVGKVARTPEALLGQYDLVFAKGRAAIEALVTGCAVVLCDVVGAGPLVAMCNLDRLRALNFGLRALQRPLEKEYLVRQIRQYDADDAQEVSRWMQTHASADPVIDRLVETYREAIDEHAVRGAQNTDEERLATVAYFRALAPRLREAHVRVAKAIRTNQDLEERRATSSTLAARAKRAEARLEAEGKAAECPGGPPESVETPMGVLDQPLEGAELSSPFLPVVGWALLPDNVIDALAGIAGTWAPIDYPLDRPDVALAHPTVRNARSSGFSGELLIPRSCYRAGRHALSVVFRYVDPTGALRSWSMEREVVLRERR